MLKASRAGEKGSGSLARGTRGGAGQVAGGETGGGGQTMAKVAALCFTRQRRKTNSEWTSLQLQESSRG